MGVQSPKQIHGTLSEKFLIFSKKIKCPKQPKKQNKLNFYFSPSGVPNVRGGWVGSDVWDKVPKKTFFLGTFPYPIMMGRVYREKIYYFSDSSNQSGYGYNPYPNDFRCRWIFQPQECDLSVVCYVSTR